MLGAQEYIIRICGTPWSGVTHGIRDLHDLDRDLSV